MGNKSSLMLQEEEVQQISDETGFTPSEIEKLYARFSLLDRSNCGTLGKSDLLSIPELAINPLCDRLLQIVFSDCDEDERINFRQFIRVLAPFRSSSTNHNDTTRSDHHSRAFTKDNHNNNDQSTDYNRSRPINAAIPSIRADGRQQQHNSHSRLGETNNNNIIKTNLDYNNVNIPFLDRMNESLKKKLSFVFKVYDADNDGRISLNDIKSILKMMVGNYIEDFQLDKIAERAFAELDDNHDGYIEFGDFCKVFSAKDLNNKLRVKFVS